MGHEASNSKLYVLESIAGLQQKVESKMPSLTRRGHGSWVNTVHFAIEIGSERIKGCKDSTEVNALMAEWEDILNQNGDHATELMRGIDFGIRLVIHRVRRCLCPPSEQKPPSVNGTTSSSGQNKEKDLMD